MKDRIFPSTCRKFSVRVTCGGGSVVICPGVTIGDRSVIGAGSLVTKAIPGGVFAAGNQCKVIRELDE